MAKIPIISRVDVMSFHTWDAYMPMAVTVGVVDF